MIIDSKYKQLEEALLKEADMLIEQAGSQGEKALYELFKSALLKKYKDSYDVEVSQGKVKKETVDKSIDFLFADVCARFRSLPNIDEYIKEDVISQAQKALGSWKTMVIQMLKDKGITVV